MSFKVAHRDECETAGNWQLVRRTLGLRAFGINVVEIAAGEQIPEHDESERDQEEVFYILSGTPTLLIDGESHTAPPGTFARLDPAHSRSVATTAMSRRTCSSSRRRGRAAAARSRAMTVAS